MICGSRSTLIAFKSAENKNSRKIPNFVFQNIENKLYHVKVLLKRFHLNGHTIGFCPQTQKLEHITRLHNGL